MRAGGSVSENSDSLTRRPPIPLAISNRQCRCTARARAAALHLPGMSLRTPVSPSARCCLRRCDANPYDSGMLPNGYRWLPGNDRSHLHFRFACVAWAQLDGSFWILGWYGSEVRGSAASKAQAMRFIERMIEVRGLPFKPRKVKRGG